MIIKTYGLKKYCLQRLALAHEKFLKYQLKSVRAEELAPPIIEMMIIATLGFIILIAFQQKVSHGAFVAFVTAMFRIRESIRVLTGSFVKLAQAQAADQRLQLTLAMPMEDTGNKTIPHFQQKLELINVSLMIDEKIILKNFSLTINKGEKVALLGASGSGKSTILSLLLKLIKPSTGSVHMDGIDLEELNNRHYRNFFSYIGQENFIVNDTLKENILFANDATATNNSNYQKALDYSLVRPILAQMPETDLTFLGDRGSRLSGGEKQRVTIARGMNKPAEILLLDEATSALDQENLLKIENHFLQYFSQKTILMVTHRLTQGQKFDKIVILRDGEKLAEGSYDDLLHKFPEYKNLYFSESVL
jgi:subfamily B ATP-binding cassette protein MsbA